MAKVRTSQKGVPKAVVVAKYQLAVDELRAKKQPITLRGLAAQLGRHHSSVSAFLSMNPHLAQKWRVKKVVQKPFALKRLRTRLKQLARRLAVSKKDPPSMTEVAAMVGLSRGRLYTYFLQDQSLRDIIVPYIDLNARSRRKK